MVYPFGGLLSLIPHLIKHLVWRCAGRGVGVAGWNTIVLRGSDSWLPLVAAGGLDTLLGPEKTPCLVFFLVRLLALSPNASLVGVVVMVWSGVWLCVECCIVDASILVWSSV